MATTPTLKEFQDRLVVLNGERDTLQSHAIAYDGAIQECEHWIKEMGTPEQVPSPPEE